MKNLDDQKLINKTDPKGMLGLIECFPGQCEKGRGIVKEFNLKPDYLEGRKIQNIMVTGLGGSAIGGDLLRTYLLNSLNIPILVNRNYLLPLMVDKNTLLIAVSYSGNTEEVISTYREAARRLLKVVCITSGGKLLELAVMNKHISIKIPKNLPPRLATPYLFFPMLIILQNSGLVDAKEDINKLLNNLKPEKILKVGQQLADNLSGKVPLIYTTASLEPAAIKFKTDINENAKMHAFYNVLPELNHNELNGFVKQMANFYVIVLEDEKEGQRMKKTISAVKSIIRKKGVPITDIVLKGDSRLLNVFTGIMIGLWTSYFLAIKNDIDPTPVEMIEDLKKSLQP